jgi:hypothetical protein
MDDDRDLQSLAGDAGGLFVLPACLLDFTDLVFA